MSETESLRFSCPGCGQHIECSAAWTGVELDCPSCSKRIRAPVPLAASTPQHTSASTGPPALPPVHHLARTKPPARRVPAWMVSAGNYGLLAPILLFGLCMAASLIPRSLTAVGVILVFFLFVSGLLAALTGLVHFFLSGRGLPKALLGIAIHLLLGMFMILPASQRAWARHREIQQEKISGVRQLHEQGMSYATNRALPPLERAKGVELLTIAANRDYGRSQYSLGYLYKNGVAAATNRVLAWKWLTLAARKGSTKAPGLIAKLQAEMSPQEIAEGQRLADAFVPEDVNPGGPNDARTR